jgi:hypothetical protein
LAFKPEKMKTEVYTINKGVNRAIEFRGLQAQYIGWLAGGLLALLVIFAAIYIIGINPYACLIIIGSAGTILFRQVFHMSRKYGQYGLMKKAAARRLPNHTRVPSRKPFLQKA